MANRKELLAAKRKELIELGYTKGLVEKSLSWAMGSAQGTAAKYAEPGQEMRMATEMLPQFLKECPKWINGIWWASQSVSKARVNRHGPPLVPAGILYRQEFL